MGMRRSFKPTNIIQNSNFTLDSNADGLADGLTIVTAGSIILLNGVQSFIATAQSGSLSCGPTVIIEHIYYFSGFVKADSSGARLRCSGSVNAVEKAHSGGGNFEYLSILTTATGSSTTALKVYDARASGWTQIQWKLTKGIDLTALFGAGNEPNVTWCDANLSEWFNGTMSSGKMGGIGGLR